MTSSPRNRIFTRRAAIACAGASAAAILWRPRTDALAPARGPQLTPEAFGAKGDGKTDDTAAFLALSAQLNANDGGDVSLAPGATYIVGRQTSRGPLYLTGQAILHAENVARFVVRMNGATIKFRDGMRLGSFEPRTGRAKNPTMPHLLLSDRADIGTAIRAEGVGFFSVSNGKIDGNSQKAIIGGEWGDTGWQATQFGIAAFGCGRVEWTDLEIVNSCQDGLLYAWKGLTGAYKSMPLLVKRVHVDRVARNCVSLVGTNSALFEDCTFERAGEAPNDRLGSFRSAPGSCLDVEAELSECRNVVIRNSKLISGSKSLTCFVADTGTSSDILLEDTLLVGAIWTTKPRTTFRRCTVHGNFARVLGDSANPADNTKILQCRIYDNPLYEAVRTSAPHCIDLEGAGHAVEISGTLIDLRHTRINLRNGIVRDVTIRFATGTRTIPNREFAILADGARFERVRINEAIPAAQRPADAFYITPPASASDCFLTSPGRKLMWTSWSPAAGGHVGRLDRGA